MFIVESIDFCNHFHERNIVFKGVLKTTSSPEIQRRPLSYTSDDMSFNENFNTSFGSMPSSLSDSIPAPKGNHKGLSYIHINQIIFLKFDKLYVKVQIIV